MITFLGALWLSMTAWSDTLLPDESLWAYAARLWVHFQAPPYIGSVENKTPGIFVLFGVSDLLFGSQYWFPRLIAIFCLVGTAVLLYRMASQWRNSWTGLIALSVYLFANAWRSFGSSYAVPETFMCLFTTLAFYWIATSSILEMTQVRRLVVAGFFMGCAIAFKQVAVLSAAALLLFIVWRSDSGNFFDQRTRRTAFWFGVGILLATGLSVVPLLVSGVSLRQYFEGAWLILLNRGDFGKYPGSSAPPAVRLHNFFGTFFRPDTFIFLASLLYIFRNRKRLEHQTIPATGLALWMMADTLGVHASGNYFPHQFKQMLPSLSLAVALIIEELFEHLPASVNQRKQTVQIAMPWLLIALLVAAPQMPSLCRAWDGLRHPVTPPEAKLGEWIETHSSPYDRVFAIGMRSNLVQYYCKRRSSSRYFRETFINPAALPEVVDDLTRAWPPRFIILKDNQAPPWLWSIVSRSYTYSFNMARFWVYDHTR